MINTLISDNGLLNDNEINSPINDKKVEDNNVKEVIDVISLALDAGTKILSAGGETYRVEDTMNRIMESFGVKEADSFVTPTGIVVSGIDPKGRPVSRVKRIPSLTVDLEKISLINDLSRKITVDHLSPEEFRIKLNEIMERKQYPLWLDLICSGIVAGSFTIFFNGTFIDGIFGFIIGLLLMLTSLLVKSLKLSSFFQNSFGGMVAVFVSHICYNLGLSNNTDPVIIGSIMLLVPGISMTNAIRDTFKGDYLSGITRASEALVTASGIAFGTASAFLVLKSTGYFGL